MTQVKNNLRKFKIKQLAGLPVIKYATKKQDGKKCFLTVVKVDGNGLERQLLLPISEASYNKISDEYSWSRITTNTQETLEFI